MSDSSRAIKDIIHDIAETFTNSNPDLRPNLVKELCDTALLIERDLDAANEARLSEARIMCEITDNLKSQLADETKSLVRTAERAVYAEHRLAAAEERARKTEKAIIDIGAFINSKLEEHSNRGIVSNHESAIYLLDMFITINKIIEPFEKALLTRPTQPTAEGTK